MSGTVLSLKKEPWTAEQLRALVDRTFYKKRHGVSTKVKLMDVGKRDVKLAEEGRVDSYTVSMAEFNKFFNLLV